MSENFKKIIPNNIKKNFKIPLKSYAFKPTPDMSKVVGYNLLQNGDGRQASCL